MFSEQCHDRKDKGIRPFQSERGGDDDLAALDRRLLPD
jgi:hypothetical protein